MIKRRQEQEEKKVPKEEPTQKPFIDIQLEWKVLRFLVFDNDFDTKDNINEINSNLAYVMFLGLPKELFSSEFKQWIFTIVLENFVKLSECVSKSFLYEELKNKFKDKEEHDEKKVLLDKIFSIRFEGKTFKPLFDKLKEKYFYRNLLELNLKINDQLKQDFVDEKSEALQLAQNIQDSVNKILTSSGKFKILEEDIVQDIPKYINEVQERRESPEKYTGITTGFKRIDQATGGWQPGELNIVLGRPGQGKSVLLLNFGYNAYMLNYNVMYVTIEMPLLQQRNRFYSLHSKIDYNKLKLPEKMSDEEVEQLQRKLNKLKEERKNFFWILDAPENCNSQFIDSRITAFENVIGQKVDLLIIDPIYLMKPTDRKSEDPVGSISWDLKLLARTRNLPVVVASQFNRESHKRHIGKSDPDAMDAAFSDKLGQNADNMIGITSNDEETAVLHFPKTRDAQISKLFFIKRFNIMKFEYDIRVDENESKTIVEKDKE